MNSRQDVARYRRVECIDDDSFGRFVDATDNAQVVNPVMTELIEQIEPLFDGRRRGRNDDWFGPWRVCVLSLAGFIWCVFVCVCVLRRAERRMSGFRPSLRSPQLAVAWSGQKAFPAHHVTDGNQVAANEEGRGRGGPVSGPFMISAVLSQLWAEPHGLREKEREREKERPTNR